ncbi:translin associated factor X [Polyplosphaeria fusca]|uniref:Translin associated factor X n=1 Tax=Polyplosphaeria fusca TaxID=682080 RepID=A0A9P4RB64_9PLEO|nr:translin associated factor X [Polyplosphaeria fusca]
MAESTKESAPSPYAAMFEGFRKDLDEHHDRRDKIAKASKDITASSKKMQVGLLMCKSLSPKDEKAKNQHYEAIANQYKSIKSDLEALNTFRYANNITGGNQEFVEAISFEHYLRTQLLITYADASARISKMGDAGGFAELSPEDYMLGILDLTGELMKYAIGGIARDHKLPAGEPSKYTRRVKAASKQQTEHEAMDIDREAHASAYSWPTPGPDGRVRNILDDLRQLRLQLEMFEAPRDTRFASDFEKKMIVMRESVEKVEKSAYSLKVRGSERPKGQLDMGEDRSVAVESY